MPVKFTKEQKPLLCQYCGTTDPDDFAWVWFPKQEKFYASHRTACKGCWTENRPSRAGRPSRGKSPLCLDCGESDPSAFATTRDAQGTPRLVKHRCKTCVAAKKKVRKANYNKSDTERDKRYRIRFGISLEDFYRILYVEQFGLCGGCGKEYDTPEREWHIDHDHQTGRVRGVLCHGCNVALGFAKDDPGTLRKLAEYLERSV